MRKEVIPRGRSDANPLSARVVFIVLLSALFHPASFFSHNAKAKKSNFKYQEIFYILKRRNGLGVHSVDRISIIPEGGT